jgi:hypothetical protein
LKTSIIVLLLAATAFAQNGSQSAQPSSAPAKQASSASAAPDLASQVPTPRSEDVKAMNGLVHAIYDVISGPAGARDWNRFRSLCVPQARFTATRTASDGSVAVVSWGVEEFVTKYDDVFKRISFYENAIVNRPQTFGHVTQVFSSYESRETPAGKVFARGINSIQLINDGKRWWVHSILWDEERPGNPLPPEFAHAPAGKKK